MCQSITGLQPASMATAMMDLRLCRICGENKPLSEFRIGPGGRFKSICRECTETLISVYLGGEGLRRCTTCGRPTTNYRCGSCWIKIRGSASPDSGLDPDYLP